MHCKSHNWHQCLILINNHESSAFPAGPKREHFLALCTPDAIKKAKELDPKIFAPAAYDTEVMITLQYLPSAAWAWAVCEIPTPSMLMFNDV